MGSAIILVDKDVQPEEFFYPYYRLQEAGFGVDVCASTSYDIKCKYGIPIKPNMLSLDLKDRATWDKYEIIVLPGGWSPEICRQDFLMLELVRWANENGRIIGGICHGPQIIMSAGISSGKKMTCYKGMQDDLIYSGAHYSDEPVIVDGNIVTSPHYRNNPDFMREILKLHKLKFGASQP